uniref:Serine/threonine protein kinase n=1 Tax=Ascaris lumbricoides TaxID=6252 RepID=A0A0M3HSA2_ASCLU
KAVKYQQSSTRQLAFGAPSTDNKSAISDSPKPLNDFYNNATLSLIAKVFSLIVILVTIFMVLGMTDYDFLGWLL